MHDGNCAIGREAARCNARDERSCARSVSQGRSLSVRPSCGGPTLSSRRISAARVTTGRTRRASTRASRGSHPRRRPSSSRTDANSARSRWSSRRPLAPPRPRRLEAPRRTFTRTRSCRVARCLCPRRFTITTIIITTRDTRQSCPSLRPRATYTPIAALPVPAPAAARAS